MRFLFNSPDLKQSLVKIVLGNVYTTLVGGFSDDPAIAKGVHEALRKELSYLVPDSEWNAKFKAGQWDGRISLYKKTTQTFPTGCTTRVVELFKALEIPYKVEDRRVRPPRNLDIESDFGTRELRFYQTEAVDRGIPASRGILAVATGGGKTMMSCQLLAEMGVGPVIFIVPSKSLLHQTHDEFQKYLKIDGKPAKIGKIGDGIFEPQPDGINICTYQTMLLAYNEVFKEKAGKTKDGKTYGACSVIKDEFAGDRVRKTDQELLDAYESTKKDYDEALKRSGKQYHLEHEKKRPKLIQKATKAFRDAYNKAKDAHENRLRTIENKRQIREIIEKAQGYLVDEAHVAAVVIEVLGQHAKNAYYRYGITATPYREDNQQIRIEGTFGRVLIRISASDLIDLEYLVKPYIRMIPIQHLEQSDSYQDAYDKHIVNNWERNFRIKQIAEECKKKGYPTMILVERLDHGVILESMVKDSAFVAGGDKGEDDPTEEERNFRRQMLAKTQRNEQILIATQWANVGIDAPALTVLILGGSGTSMVTTMQQIGRVLRTSPDTGKGFALIFDFMSDQKHLHDHAVRREKIYKSESAFDFKRIRS